MFVTILYHSVDDNIDAAVAISREAFARQLLILRREGFAVLSIDEAIAQIDSGTARDTPSVLITFDDGYRDNVTAALPMLSDASMSATMFVITSVVGQSNRWNPRACYDTTHASWDELRQWVAAGHDIGAHGHEHFCMTRLARPELTSQLATSRHLLETTLGRRVRAFAYPYGWLNATVRDETARHYEIAFSVDSGVWAPATDRHTVNRVSVTPKLNDDAFVRTLWERWNTATVKPDPR